MTQNEFLQKMWDDKKFYNQASAIKGFSAFLNWEMRSGHRQYLETTEHRICPTYLLAYYKPEEEGTDQGFGEYGIFATPLNSQGLEELTDKREQLEQAGLLQNIGNIRYESFSVDGLIHADPEDSELEDPADARIRKHNTSNLLLWAGTSDCDIRIKDISQVIVCQHPKWKRCVHPFLNEYLERPLMESVISS